MEEIIKSIVQNPKIVAGIIGLLVVVVAAALFSKSGFPCQCPACTAVIVPSQVPGGQNQFTYNPMSYESVSSGSTLLTYLFGFLIFIGVIWIVQQINEKYGLESKIRGLGDRGRQIIG